MTRLTRILLLCVLGLHFTHAGADPDDLSFEDMDEATAAAPDTAKPAATAGAAVSTRTADETRKRWYVIIPAFVMHGSDPSGGANLFMPRRITGDGRFVATPGIGVEFQGHRGLEFAAAFVKDCYDNPAGALQVGQHWRIGTGWDLGYSAGVYVRKTPIACMTSTVTTTFLGRRGQPSRVNTLTTRQCAFQDNLPLRYTTRVNGGYMDIIPTPFLHASARVFHGPFDVYLKAISNYYLTEFGLTIPF